MTLSCDLTIFEGPDGGGKSTAAKAYAEATNARYVHFPSLPRITGRGLARMYLEAMLPALHGYQNVVFDRCWLSEEPYGSVFRPHQPFRVDKAQQRMLERIAMRCNTRLVYCLPGLEVCLDTFRSRKGEEMLDREEQLQAVYRRYDLQVDYVSSHLPFVVFDRTKDNIHDNHFHVIPNDYWSQDCSMLEHDTRLATVGNRLAPVCLVGEAFTERKDNDAWQQYPFVSFNRQGCSAWLADYLESKNVREDELCWANADFDLELLDAAISAQHYIALGATAAKALDDAGLPYSLVSHPQHQKRFNSHDEYPLGPKLRALIDRSVAAAPQGSAPQRS
jgi:thymidylate kinase